MSHAERGFMTDKRINPMNSIKHAVTLARSSGIFVILFLILVWMNEKKMKKYLKTPM